MTLIILGIYLFFLAFIWGFFIVAKIHAYKFKNFSYNIEKVTRLLFIVLVLLSLWGFYLVFTLDFVGSVSIPTSENTRPIVY